MHPVSSVSQAAAFALFEQLRLAHDLPLDRAGDLRATCLRAIDPAVCGLAYTNAGDAALELMLEGPDGQGRTAYVHAASDTRGPWLSVFFSPERPVLQVRLAPPSLLALEDDRFLLRERPTFPSHDGRQEERKELAARLARPFGVPYVAGWLHLGAWDALDRAWEPETGRRALATAVLLDRARHAAFAPGKA
ncbi:MAG: hypothetical protein JWM80_6236 [Cyanobacteria bacterium RYN_339]|nr:hypothetical protein [Cyanobacteria bacterium RYN_339]